MSSFAGKPRLPRTPSRWIEVLFFKKNCKNLRGRGGRGNLGFPTIKYVFTQKPNVFFFGSNVNFIKALKRYEFFFRAEVLFTGDYIRLL